MYLLDSIGPSLLDAVFGPNVVRILCEFVHQHLLTWGQFDVGQVQRSRLIAVRHHVATRKKNNDNRKKGVSAVMEVIKSKSRGAGLPTFIV